MSSEVLEQNAPANQQPSGIIIPEASVDVPPTIIEPIGERLSFNLGEVWRYRDLFTLMVLRNLSARYRQSIAGYAWAIIKPLTSMVIFTVIFSRVAGIPSDGSPYPLFVLAGIIPWSYFSTSLAGVTNCIAGGGSLLTKVYFPRLILPLVSVATGLAEVIVQLLVVFGMLVWYGINPGFRLLALPILIMYTSLAVLSIGLWTAALNVKYRDVGLATPFLIQCGMWLSPIVYSSTRISDRFRPLYNLNPMAGVIECFRWILTGKTQPDWVMMGVSGIVVLFLLFAGTAYFRKTELTFADLV